MRRIYHCVPTFVETPLRPELAPSSPRGSSARAPLELPAGADVAPPPTLESESFGMPSFCYMTVESKIAPAMPPHPRDDGAPRPKWNSKWDFDREGKRVRIIVVAHGPGAGQEETIDAREFIERLGENHEGTTFAIHVETEQIGSNER